MVLVKLPGKKKVRNETQMRKLSDSTVMTKCADILNWSFFLACGQMKVFTAQNISHFTSKTNNSVMLFQTSLIYFLPV